MSLAKALDSFGSAFLVALSAAAAAGMLHSF